MIFFIFRVGRLPFLINDLLYLDYNNYDNSIDN